VANHVGLAMKRIRRHPLTLPMLSLCGTGIVQTGCGYGFGNHEFREEQAAAIAFAQALQVQDTTRMRQMSWGAVKDSILAIVRETPRAYTAFTKPVPQLLTITGGGVYGGTGGAEFLVESGQLDSCHGGVRLFVLMVEKSPEIASMRLVPPLDSLSDDACRAAIDGSSGADDS
jgi:hypothetical protein